VIRSLRNQGQCLVHGDFSPKNLLVTGSDRLMLIDWEVVHFGSPLFDPAFLLSHLTLKALHAGSSGQSSLEQSIRTFWQSYQSCLSRPPETGSSPSPSASRSVFAEIAPVLGALVLARVDGKSPVDYLTPEEQEVARAFGLFVLVDPPNDLETYLASLKGRMVA
jgi:serine/threonine protein kinase